MPGDAIFAVVGSCADLDATIPYPWMEAPRRAQRLRSLWEIVRQFKLLEVADFLLRLTRLETSVDTANHATPGEVVDDVTMSAVKLVLAQANDVCAPIGFRKTDNAAERILGHIRMVQFRPTWSALRNELMHLTEALFDDMFAYTFVQVSADSDVDNDFIFGQKVHARFPRATVDLCQSGNCMAVELHTAAVFHLMRAAEHGLRWLARRLRVRLTHSGVRMPIEYADWGIVVTAIKNKLAAAHKLPHGPRRQRQLGNYSSAADHCEYLKDMWRNDVAHARKLYDRPEAELALSRIRDFLMFLASIA